ncbi:MAG: CDP-glycerol glycerophosphotransferase family protein [Oscillospiraceae bacterium]|nr:CDP-glycerol glycerophosphotransferase family protein [Oscillospiraceae bacterium]MCL2278860.1 CDP-glycerol glycerophosphotransferase family protein [Oscillospiraceae bacterium]
MRKHQQRQILELLKTIESAQAESLFADCQDGAIAVGEFIEDLVGEGTETVSLLEEYCELVFKAHNGEIGDKPLKRQLVKIRNSVNFELKPDKIEMAFLSYKASMSDSLESIYLAAKEDPNCDAYWIPIPYDSRNPDGTVKEHFFEGADCYPDYIECIDWQKYDIEERRPDAIFTFAPYDGYNYVSRVHPDFYCERLKNLTDCLVYVPYFVSTTHIEGHFATLQGCIHADKVIVQSEELRKIYIDEYKKAFGNELGKPEDKFIALGSPKFDKVINTKREDCMLPDKWKKLICGKKVILYNTSIGAILTGGEQYLVKLRSVLEAFNKSDELVLWWRPHPLSESTYRSMRATMADEYLRIVGEYKSAGFGIYDDTPDLHRSIACTDAYYGDWSSLVPMYQATGKPIVYQDISAAGDIALRFAEFAVDDDGNCWGFDSLEDGLFKLDFENNTALLAAQSGSIPTFMGKKYYRSTHRYIGISGAGNNVYCFPHFLKEIFVYNRRNKSTEKIPLSCDYLLTPESDGFALRYTVKYKGYIYCFGYFSKAVVALNTTTHDVLYDEVLFEKIGLLTDTGDRAKYPVYISDCSEDGKINLIMRNCPHLIRYTLHTQNVEYIASNQALSHCLCADFDGEFYWLIGEANDKLIRWNPYSNDISEFKMADDGFTFPDAVLIFTGITDCGEYLLLFPGFGEYLLKFDKAKEQFSECTDMPVAKGSGTFNYDKPKVLGDKVYAFARHNNTMYVLDKRSDGITWHSFKLANESHESYYSDINNSLCNDEISYGIYEGLNAGLNEHTIGCVAAFFAIILNSELQAKTYHDDLSLNFAANLDGTSGKAIYDYINEVL